MKTLFKWLFRLVGLVVVVVVAAVLLRNPILKNWAEWRIHAETGLDARIGYLYVGLTEPILRIENLKLYNPPESGGETFLDVPELYVEYDRGDALLGRIHLKLVRLNLAEVNVVAGKDGRTNLELLLARQPPKAHPPSGARDDSHPQGNPASTSTAPSGRQSSPASIPPRRPADSRRSGDLPLVFTGIDTLNLTLGRVRFINLGNPNQTTELALNVKNAELKNVKSSEDLSGFILNLLAQRGAGLFGAGPGVPTNAVSGPAKGAPSAKPGTPANPPNPR